MTQSTLPPERACAHRHGLRHSASRLALVLALAGSLGACQKARDMASSLGDVTGSISPAQATPPSNEADLQRYVSEWGKRYDRRPDDKQTALAFARGLRAAQRYEQAVAVLQRAAMKAPSDLDILAAYGKALADAGRFREANQVLERALTPERPNWSVLSTLGSVADQLGNNEVAQDYYRQALKIVPGEPSILSNYGLSLALSKRLPEAEQMLRQAASHPRADSRVRQNLSLVLALQGKFQEAEAIQRQSVSAVDAAANIAAIRRMIAQSNTWRDIQKLDAGPQQKGRQARVD